MSKKRKLILENTDKTKTLDQCLEEVLMGKNLNSRWRKWKFRLKCGTLKHETKEKIVTDAGYVLVEEAKYEKKD